MSLILFTRGESVTVYCVPSHMIVSVFCSNCFSVAISLVLLLHPRWAAKFILMSHPQY